MNGIRNNMVLVLILLSLLSCKQTALIANDNIPPVDKAQPEKHPDGLQKKLRIFGYLQVWDGKWNTNLDKVNLSQVTDLCISFLNPDPEGTFIVNQEMIAAVDRANKMGIRVFFAIGGGGGPEYWDDLLKVDKRTKVISNMRKILTTYNFDGIDADLENSRITADYNDFVIALSDTLRKHKKLLSIAIARFQGDMLSAQVYGRADFLNVMSYDKRSEGNTAGNYSHSPLKLFESDFEFFSKKVDAKKINMGIPGYAWENENNKRVQQVALKTILDQYPTAYRLNTKTLSATKALWFDGHPVLRQKVAYASKMGAGGMMIWQMLHDPLDDASSLLKLINYCAANPGSNGFDPGHRYFFAARHSMMLMEAGTAAGNPQQNTPNGTDNQKWAIQIENGKSKIVNINSNLVLTEKEGDREDEAMLVLMPSNGSPKQQFEFLPDEFGFYKVVNVASGRVITVKNAAMGPAEKLVLSKDENLVHQRWIVYN